VYSKVFYVDTVKMRRNFKQNPSRYPIPYSPTEWEAHTAN